MSDQAEITSLIVGVMMAIDDRDRETFANSWANDAVMEFRLPSGQTIAAAGKEKILEFVEAQWRRDKLEAFHVVSAPKIALDGDRATVRYFTSYYVTDSPPRPPGIGQYRTEVRKEPDGKWRLTRQHIHMRSHPRDGAPGG
jgi:uncharacterized protein (TIGR02246 family)